MRASSLILLSLPALALTSCDKLKSAVGGLGSKKAAPTAPARIASVATLKPEEFAAFTAASRQRLALVRFQTATDANPGELTHQIEALAKKYPDQLTVGVIDVDHARELATKQGVTSTPELWVYRDGMRVERIAGSPTTAELEAKIAGQVAQLKPNLAVELAAKKSAIAPKLDDKGNPIAPAAPPVQAMERDWKPAGFERAQVPKADPNSKEKAEIGKIVNSAKGTADAMAASGAAGGSTTVRDISAGEFDAFKGTGNDKVVIIDFHADWCGPCRVLGPRLAAAAQQSGGKVVVGKINVDAADAKQLTTKLSVSAIPDVRIFRNGKQVDSFVGELSSEEVNKRIAAQVKALDAPKAKDGKAAPAAPAVPPIQRMEKGWVPPGMEKGK